MALQIVKELKGEVEDVNYSKIFFNVSFLCGPEHFAAASDLKFLEQLVNYYYNPCILFLSTKFSYIIDTLFLANYVTLIFCYIRLHLMRTG